jgi:hypothetical protein
MENGATSKPGGGGVGVELTVSWECSLFPQFSDEFSQQIFAHLDRKASGNSEHSHETVSSTPTPPPPGFDVAPFSINKPNSF